MFTLGTTLGSGHFGSVFMGEATGLIYPESKTKVAVKTVNNVLDLAQFKVREIKRIKYFWRHPYSRKKIIFVHNSLIFSSH
jgi:hypothetical protein